LTGEIRPLVAVSDKSIWRRPPVILDGLCQWQPLVRSGTANARDEDHLKNRSFFMTKYKAGKNVSMEIKIIDGELHCLSCVIDGKELWIPVSGMKIENPKCSKCGYEGIALDKHHVHGRKNSEETIYLCSNCHRELHNEIGYKL
jgi:hypothetical protein